jgi:phenylpropionate dioxygenase-like ring-hydroxylating dioxygenase large terminal subunit
MAQPSNEAVEKLLTKGLRDMWYAFCPSSFVKDQPISIRRCGYKIVLWRGIDGKLNALEDHCPHRGAPLSLGKPMGDRIACDYHGVEVDRNGVAVRVPGQPGCQLEGMKATHVFPVEEAAGMIFGFVSDAKDPKPTKLTLPEQLTSPEFSSFLCYAEWVGDYRYVMDNVMDPMHGTYLHKMSHSMSEGETQAKFRIRDTATGYVFEKEGQRDVNFDWTEFIDAGAHWLRLEIPYPKTGGPGGNFHIVGTYTPITDTTSAVVHWRCRKLTGWQRDVWRFLYKNRLEARHWHVLEQDRKMLANYEPDARDRELLYNHDMGLMRLRRLLKQKAIQQLSQEAGASHAA